VSERQEKKDTGLGEETKVERVFNRYIGDAIHIFLSVLAVLILAAAAIAAFEMLKTDVPKLWQPSGGYKELQQIISNVLLVAIAAELGLLLLFHRTSAAIEVIIFVIARKIVTPDVSAMELLLSVAALAGLLIVRFYYLPGKPK
jgi:hypothetical protein